ncbi:hypothetical protein F8M41_025852 [Gigaspora margarita]|uniref:Uncharacterized protein n=1 Tax=Gigaspora margarita TaxID=4874 RepID=A0A8H4AAS2_GIGMA|nr:hypothetical protein F8M41_025852 [Gigaspora margarita]
MKFNNRFYFLVFIICTILAACAHSAPVPDDDKKKETIKIDTDKIKVTEDEKKEEFTIKVPFKVTNGPKDCKIDASIKVKSGKGTISGDSKQTIKADDDSVSFKVVVKDGDKATFTITLEDKDAKIKVSVDVTIKEAKDDKKKETIKIDKDKITVTEDKKKKEEFTIKVPFKVTNGPKDCKIDASIKVKSDKGKISGDSKKTIKADDDSVSFKVVVKDGEKDTFTITLEDKDEKIKASVDVTIKNEKD